MVFSFLQRKSHPLTRCINKIADQPCYNIIVYLRRTEHKYLKAYALCLPLINKCCQIANFSTSFLSSFYNQKKLFNTECNFLYY